MDILIKGGTVVTAEGKYEADIAIDGEKITGIGYNIQPLKETEVVDAKGMLVLPGAIDSHTHLSHPFMGTTSTDDYFTGTRSAACGGTTTIFDFVMQNKGESMVDAVNRRYKLAQPNVAIDFAYHISVVDISTPELYASMDKVVDMGVRSFKVFTVYDFAVSDADFYRALQKAASINALIGIHAENKEVSNLLIKQYQAEGKKDSWWHYMSKNEPVEGEADIRAINLAKMAGAPLYIAHLADWQGVEAVTRAREEGCPIFAETCPQYLYFTSDVYKTDRAPEFVCSPPIKDQKSQDALWAALKRGDIDVIGTDHCPFTLEQKAWGKRLPDGREGDFTTIPNGCAGIENMYPYMLSEANKGRITFSEAVKLCSSNTAKLFGIDDRKGFIAPGYDADIVIYNPHKDVVIHNKDMHGQLDHTIWEDVPVNGYPVATYCRGKLVYKDGQFLGSRGYGRYVKAHALHFDGPVL